MLLTFICLTCFLVASGLLLFGFRSGSSARKLVITGHGVFLAGVLALTLDSVNSSLGASSAPTGILLATALGWISIISWFVWRLELIGAFTAPLIALVLMLQGFFGHAAGVARGTESLIPIVTLHVASAVLGQTLVVAACATSLLFLWQQRLLKSRQVEKVPASFPAMDTLARALAAFLWSGFILITLSVLSGAAFTMIYGVPVQMQLGIKILWAILVWVWYLAILVLRNILGYSTQKVARMSLIGFVLVAISGFGMVFVGSWGGGL